MTAGAGSQQRSQTCYYSQHGRGLVTQSPIPQQEKGRQQGLSTAQEPGEFAEQVQHQGRQPTGRVSSGISRQDSTCERQLGNQLSSWSGQQGPWPSTASPNVAQAEAKHPWLSSNEAPEPMGRGVGRGSRWGWSGLLNPIGSLRPPDISQWNIQTHIFMHKQEKRRIMIVVWPVLHFLTPECLIAQPWYYSNAVSTHSLYKHRIC